MSFDSSIAKCLLVAAIGAAVAQTATAETSRRIQVIDSTGAHIVRLTSPFSIDSPYWVGGREGLLWHYNDPAGIIESCALADTVDDAWIGVNLNFQRLGYFSTSGDGTELFNYDAAGADMVAVASAEDVSLGVMLMVRDGKLNVLGFTATGGNTPAWSYVFDAPYTGAGPWGADVSADGSVVLVCGRSGGSADPSRLVQINGLTGAVVREDDLSVGAMAVDVSDDGSRAALTLGATTSIIDTATAAELFSFAVSGSGGEARLSGNGMVAVAGGFNLRCYRDTGAGWTLAYTEQESTQWYGNGLALSNDGTTLFAGSRNYSTSELRMRVIDVVNSVELARLVSAPTGAKQDVFERAEATADGSYFAAGTWGQETNPHDEVMVLDRDANIVAGIDMPGSAFCMDFTRDGRYVLASGKHVHANDFGNGGDAYVYERDVIGCPEDLTGDGYIGQEDLGELLSSYGVDDGGDIDGDGDTDQADLGALLALYGQDCP